jgi:hypothetical protein
VVSEYAQRLLCLDRCVLRNTLKVCVSVQHLLFTVAMHLQLARMVWLCVRMNCFQSCGTQARDQ